MILASSASVGTSPVKQPPRASRCRRNSVRALHPFPMQKPRWQPRSLRRLALHEMAGLEGASRRARMMRAARTAVWNVTHHRWWALALLLPALGFAYLPLTSIAVGP